MRTATCSITFGCPVWTISGRSIKISDTLCATGATGMRVVPLFMDKDSARAFLRSDPAFADSVIRTIAEPVGLFGFLTLLEQVGFEFLLIDPSTSSDLGSRMISVADLRADVEACLL